MKKNKLFVIIFLLVIAIIVAFILLFTKKDEQIDITPPVTKESKTITIYFGNSIKNPNAIDCAKVYETNRTINIDQAGEENFLKTTLEELFKGPTTLEKEQGYYSFFSTSTADILLKIKVVGEVAYLNLSDIRIPLANASTSCGSQEFLSEINQTIKSVNPDITKIIFAINGSPESFYNWIQMGCSETDNYCDPKPFK